MVFYSDKNGNCKHNADHRRQIEASEIKLAKKKIRKKRRILDKDICSFDEDIDYQKDNCKITYKMKYENGIYKNHTLNVKSEDYHR